MSCQSKPTIQASSWKSPAIHPVRQPISTPLLPYTSTHSLCTTPTIIHPNAPHLYPPPSPKPSPPVFIESSRHPKERKKEPTNTKRNTPQRSFSRLQPRINLLNNIPPRPSRPIATSLRNSRRQLDLLDFVRVRDRVDVQAAGHVPGYVAVESCGLKLSVGCCCLGTTGQCDLRQTPGLSASICMTMYEGVTTSPSFLALCRMWTSRRAGLRALTMLPSQVP